MNEFFPVESVAMDSPRVVWLKKVRAMNGGILTMHSPGIEQPWCVWWGKDAHAGSPNGGLPDNPDECGYGNTEDEAIECLAMDCGIRLWNEQP